MNTGITLQVLSLVVFIIAMILHWSNINKESVKIELISLITLIVSTITGIIALFFMKSSTSIVFWIVYLITSSMQYMFILFAYSDYKHNF